MSRITESLYSKYGINERKPLREGAQHTNHIKKILNSVADYLDSSYNNCNVITDGDNLKISENGFEETYNLSYDLVPVYTLSTPLDGVVFAYANENDLYSLTDGQRLSGLNDDSAVSYIVNIVRDDIRNSR